ncbi:helix-turn-helix domain-containing protein, partial [Bacteroides fragilis]
KLVITDAEAKLKSTDFTIQEIAYSLNFPDISFFGKYFKRYTGMSPKQYREST